MQFLKFSSRNDITYLRRILIPFHEKYDMDANHQTYAKSILSKAKVNELIGVTQREIRMKWRLSRVSKWALKNTTKLRNVNPLKAYIQSVFGALHKFI